MKNPLDYVEELKDLTVDLSEAIEAKNIEKLNSVISECRAVLNDIEESTSI
jgi:hypothetical protein